MTDKPTAIDKLAEEYAANSWTDPDSPTIELTSYDNFVHLISMGYKAGFLAHQELAAGLVEACELFKREGVVSDPTNNQLKEKGTQL